MSAQLKRLPTAAPSRAIIYLRQSTYREESISLEVQERAARDHAERNGYEVVGVESDPGISGRSWKQRRGVQNALAAIEAGKADVVVVWRWSRLSRNRRDWAVAADMADLAGGRIESATEPNDQSAAGRFARGVMTELAAFESERIGEQWQEARDHRVARGLPSTGGARFGYRIVDRAYVPDPETAPVLAELYRLYLAGQGSTRLAGYLNGTGIPRTRTNRPWGYSDVFDLLDSGFAAGLLVRTPPRPKNQPTASAPRARVWEREFREGSHPAIIDRATWDAYVAARRERTRARSRTDARMLAGILRCLDCGGPMHHNSWKKGRMYVCSRGSRYTGHRQVSVNAQRVEAAVEAWVLAQAADLTAIAGAVERTEERGARIEMTARRAQQQIERVEARLTTLALKLADGTISDAAYRLAAESLEAERKGATELLQKSARNPVRDSAPLGLSRDLARQWPGMTDGVRNALLRPLIAYVGVRPAKHRGDRSERWVIVPSWDAETDEG